MRIFRSFAILLAGTALGQIILFLFSPILTRLYDPQAFGFYSITASVIAVLLVIVNGKYDRTILLPKDDDKALGLFGLSLVFSIVVALLLTFLFYCFGTPFLSVVGRENMSGLIVWFPVLTLLASLFESAYCLGNRLKEYKILAWSRVFSALTYILMAVLFFSTGFVNFGLILAYAVGRLGPATFMLACIFDRAMVYKLKKVYSLGYYWRLAKEYRDFPLVNASTALVHNISLEAPVFIVLAAYSLEYVGYFGLTALVLSAPMSLFGRAASDVFYQRITNDINDGREIMPMFWLTAGFTFAIALSIAFILVLFGPVLFSFVFGATWEVSGIFAKYLSVALIAKMTAFSVLTVFPATRNLKTLARFRFVYFAITVSVLAYGSQVFGMTDFIILFSTTEFFLYTGFFIVAYVTARSYTKAGEGAAE